MKVLFLMFSFPNLNHSFNIYTVLVEEFVKNGHEVVVIAPDNQKTRISIEQNIAVLRVKTLPIKNIPNVLKGISNILLPFQYGRALRKYYGKKLFDIIFLATPPITLVDLAVRLKKETNARLYLMLRDIFPQNAVDLKIMSKKSIFYIYFRRKEQKLYRNADFIGCMSPANIEFLIKNNPFLKRENVHVLNNFQRPYSNRGQKFSELARKFRIENRFVVVFGGNLGKAQQLENVLELAGRAKVFSDVVFLILGEGLQYHRLEREIRSRGLNNIILHPTLPKQDFQDLLTLCHVGLISLHADFTVPNIPSKALDYFNIGIPVLASLDYSTDFGKILEREKCGLWTYAGKHETLFELFKRLYFDEELRQQLGTNGRNYFKRELQPDNAYFTIINAILNN